MFWILWWILNFYFMTFSGFFFLLFQLRVIPLSYSLPLWFRWKLPVEVLEGWSYGGASLCRLLTLSASGGRATFDANANHVIPPRAGSCHFGRGCWWWRSCPLWGWEVGQCPSSVCQGKGLVPTGWSRSPEPRAWAAFDPFKFVFFLLQVTRTVSPKKGDSRSM